MKRLLIALLLSFALGHVPAQADTFSTSSAYGSFVDVKFLPVLGAGSDIKDGPAPSLTNSAPPQFDQTATTAGSNAGIPGSPESLYTSGTQTVRITGEVPVREYGYAFAEVQNPRFGGAALLVTADKVVSETSIEGTPCGLGLTMTGKTILVNAYMTTPTGTQALPNEPAPNTVAYDAGGVRLVLNEQWVIDNGPAGKQLEVIGMHYYLTNAVAAGGGLMNGDIIVARSLVEMHCTFADVSVTKTATPDPVLRDQNVTYTLSVRNDGPNAAPDVRLSDALPAGFLVPLSVTTTRGLCSTAQTVDCNLGAMAAGATATITIVARTTAAGSVDNTAIVTGGILDLNPANNTSTATVQVIEQADLLVAKTADRSAADIGELITFTVSVRNLGPHAATATQVTDTMPAGLDFVSSSASQGSCSGSSTITCALGTLAAGSTATVTIVARTTTTGSFTNVAVATSDIPDPVPGNSSDDATVTVQTIPPSANLSVTKTASQNPVETGDTLVYTIVASNAGPNAADNVTVQDVLPAGMTFVSATASQGNCSGSSTITCSLGTINSGSTATVMITVLSQTAGAYMNTVTVTSSVSDPDPSDNTDSEPTDVNDPPAGTPRADLRINKTDNADPVERGGSLIYTIEVTNDGPDAADNVSVQDTLPGGMAFLSSATTQGSCVGSSTITCSLGTLASGAKATVTISVQPQTAGTFTNIAGVTSSTNDPNPTNNNDSEPTAVNEPTSTTVEADLSITKTDSPDPVVRGNIIAYTIVVQNHGPQEATSVIMQDPLPAGVTLVSANSSAGTCNGTTTITCGLGNLASGQAAQINVTVRANVAGTIANTASVSSPTADPDGNNNFSTVTTTVIEPTPGVPVADIAITKSGTPDPVQSNGTITYTMRVTNLGPDDAPGVAVNDPLPLEATFVSATSTQGSCGGTNRVYCELGALPNGATATITLVVRVGQLNHSIMNVASAFTTGRDPVATNNTAVSVLTVQPVAVAGRADLSVLKVDERDPVSVGEEVVYFITVSNAGPDTAAAVTMTDRLPASLRFVSAVPTVGRCSSGSEITCSLGDLAPGAKVAVRVTVLATAAGTVTNTAVVRAATADPNMANNTSSETTTILGAGSVPPTEAEPSLEHDGCVSGACANQLMVIPLFIRNGTASSLQNFGVKLTVPEGLVVQTLDIADGACSGTSNVDCSFRSIASRAVGAIQLSVVATRPGLFHIGVESATGEKSVIAVRAEDCQLSEERLIALAGGLVGSNGSMWRTEITVLNLESDRDLDVAIEWYPFANAAARRQSTTFTARPGLNSLQLVLEKMNGLTELGSMRLTANGRFEARVQLINARPDGTSVGDWFTAKARNAARTAGVLYPLMNGTDMVSTLGYFNPSASPVSLTVNVLDGSGSVVGTRSIEVAPHSNAFMPLSNLFEGTPAASSSEPLYVSFTADSALLMFAAVTDQASGDSNVIFAEGGF